MQAIPGNFNNPFFAKIHKILRATPAMEAGLTKDVMSIEEIVRLAD
jgi:hypothetical protein